MLLNGGQGGLLRDDRKRDLWMFPSISWQMISYIALPRNKGSQTILTMAARHSIIRIECRRMRRATLAPYLDLLPGTGRVAETAHGSRPSTDALASGGAVENPRG